MTEFNGAILGIDHGLKVIGLALSRTGYFAEPLRVIYRESKAEDFQIINQIIVQENVTAIVLGLPPIPPDFVGYPQAEKVRNWAGYLYEVVSVPIYFWDEGLSSFDAAILFDDLGKAHPDRIDAHAAAVILQTCLDAIHEGQPLPEPFVP